MEVQDELDPTIEYPSEEIGRLFVERFLVPFARIVREVVAHDPAILEDQEHNNGGAGNE